MRFCLVLLLPTLPCYGAAPAVAFVVDPHGKWVTSPGGRMLEAWSPLAAGERIRHSRPAAEGDSIVLENPSGQIILRITCDGSNRCLQEQSVPQPVSTSDSLMARIMAAATALLQSTPDKYRNAGSRGAGLEEAVLTRTGGQIELTGMLRNLAADRYSIQLVPQDGPAVAAFDVDWKPPAVAFVTAGNLEQGIYLAQLLDRENHVPLEPGSEAWVAICDGDACPTAREQFQAAQEVGRSWEGEVASGTIREFLRAALEAISQHTVK